jgi:hypothetical protein
MSKTYSVASLVGKPLLAKTATKLYRLPTDKAISYASVKSGSPLGVLYSWVSPNKDTTSLWFMFYDSLNKPYYAKYNINLVDRDDLARQGIKDIETITKEKKEKEERESKGAVQFYFEKYAPFLIAAVFVIPIAKQIIDKKL